MPGLLDLTGGQMLALVVALVVWAATLAGVYWDLTRLRVPNFERAVWMAIVAFLPGVGLLAYLLTRMLNRYLPLSDGAPNTGMRRLTQLRAPAAPAPRTGTILASELVKETVFDRPPQAPIVSPLPLPPSAPSISLHFTAVAGEHAGDEFTLKALPARIGRGGTVALRLDRDRGVSREHAELYAQAGTLRLRDLGSQHGTTLNGRRITDAALHVGDRIELGLSALIVKRADV